MLCVVDHEASNMFKKLVAEVLEAIKPLLSEGVQASRWCAFVFFSDLGGLLSDANKRPTTNICAKQSQP